MVKTWVSGRAKNKMRSDIYFLKELTAFTAVK